MARTQVIKNCEGCGREFSRRFESRREGRFCSFRCMQQHFTPASKPVNERFWSKVDKAGPGGCWFWMASSRGKDYGNFRLNGKNEAAHRVAWILMRGPIPEGQQVLHHCDVRRCVNAESHLWLGTHDDNMADKMNKGRGNHLAGVNHPNALFEAQEIDAIRSSCKSISALSREYGVSRITIQRIKNRKAWLQPLGGTPLPDQIESQK